MTNTVEKNTCEDNSIVPPKYRILSGSWLKVIAVVTMLIDHIASVLLREDPILIFSVLGRAVTLYEIMRTIGRIAFPLFAFLLVEGFIHTSNRKKYGTNLLAFAFISELPWNLEHTGKLFCSSQNVFFTLFFGFIGLCIIENFKGKKRVGYLLIMLAVTLIFRADYGCVGFGFLYPAGKQIVSNCFRCMRSVNHLEIGSCFYSDQSLQRKARIHKREVYEIRLLCILSVTYVCAILIKAFNWRRLLI